MYDSPPNAPGALLGHTKHGSPIYLVAGGSQPAGEPPPAPGVPTPPPAPPPPAPPTPNPAPPANPSGTGPAAPAEDLASLPDWAQKAIRDARADAGKARTTAKQTAADEARTQLASQIAKALGIKTGDEPPDPAQLTEQVEQAQAAAWRSGVELNVYRIAGSLGANAEALLDSLTFIESLDDLTEVDPRSAEFKTQLEAKVQAALERNPSYKANGQAPGTPNGTAAPRPDPSQGGRGQQPQPQKFTGSLTDAIRSHYAALQQK